MFFSKPAGDKFIDRGDIAAVDFLTESLTKNGSWQELVLSGIIPANAKSVLLRLYVVETTGNLLFMFRKNGYVNEGNAVMRHTYGANLDCAYDITVPCNSSGIVDYLFVPGTWSIAYITVGGWWI
jgi:hypothetical protein